MKKILSILLLLIVFMTMLGGCSPIVIQDNVEGSKGLEYRYNPVLNSYYVSGMGICTDEELVIPSMVKGHAVSRIDEEAFKNCRTIKSVIVPDSVEYVFTSAFENCTSLISVVIGNSVKSLNLWTFVNCTSLTSVVLGDSLESIGDGAFRGCIALESIEIPDSVTTIERTAFARCSSLKNIVISEYVTNIGDMVFNECSSLMNIEVDENNPNYKSIDGNLYTKDGKVFLGYAMGKKEESFTIPDSVAIIDRFLFDNCTSLKSIIIPDSVIAIEEYAFYGCTSLMHINFAGTVEQWNAIGLDSSYWNDQDVPASEIVCSDGTVKLK